MKLIYSTVALVCTLLAASPASAAEGVLLAQRITSGTTVTTTEVQIEKTRMRAEISGGPSAQVVIFDGAKQAMYVLNPAQKTYMEITKADLEQMGAMMQGMMAQMANLPPAARAQMEGMMRGRGMGGPAVPITYKRIGADRVGAWACDKYDGYRADEKVTEICTVAPAALGFTAADFAVSQQLVEFLRTALPQLGDQVAVLGRTDVDGFSGLPVRTVSNTAGRTVTTEVTAARRQNFADSIFAIPADFKRQAMMGRGN
jgi:hypothetical protein